MNKQNLLSVAALVMACAASTPALAADAKAPVVFPPDMGIVDVTKAPYNAVPNDGKDDVAAINQAMADYPNRMAIIYLPDGTYDISDTISWPPGGGGGTFKRTTLQGQSQAGTVIRLMDNAPGYNDAKKPKAMAYTGPKPAQRFGNEIRNITFDTGRGNAGAIGVQYNTSNRGTIRDVTIRSTDGGVYGLDMRYTGEIGPCLIRDVTIIGFNTGVACGHVVNSMTFERLTLRNQSETGLVNDGNIVTMRGLQSTQEKAGVPAIRNNGGNSMLTLLEAQMQGSGEAAVANAGAAFVRDSTATGYAAAVMNTNGLTPAPEGLKVQEWVSHPVLSLFTSPARSLRLPIRETPEVSWGNIATDWVSPLMFGVDLTKKKRNDTEAFQKALNAGKSTVYLPLGTYNLSGEITIPAGVSRIIGGGARLTGEGRLVVAAGAEPLVFERIEISYARLLLSNKAGRTLILSSSAVDSYEGEGGVLFVDDVTSSPWASWTHKNQQVWARQWNPENSGTHISNDGGQVWVLGLKTERGGVQLESKNGAKTEILGGHAYSTSGPKATPMFVVDNSSFSVTIGETNFNGNPFIALVQETRNGATKTLWKGDAPGRANGSMLPLYAGFSGDGAQTKPVQRTEAPPAMPVPKPVPPKPTPISTDIPAAARATFPAGLKVLSHEDFNALKAGRLNEQGGWSADKPEGVTIVQGANGNDSLVAQIRGTGNSTDKANYRVAEKLFENPGFKDSDTVFYGFWTRAEGGAYNMPAWETNAGPRVPRKEGQPLTKNQFAFPDGLGPQFGIDRSPNKESTRTYLRLRTAGGLGGAQEYLSKETAMPGHWYELRLVIKPVGADATKATGTLYYRNITAGETEFSVSSIQDVPLRLSATNKPSLWGAWVFQGKNSGQYDNFTAGVLSANVQHLAVKG